MDWGVIRAPSIMQENEKIKCSFPVSEPRKPPVPWNPIPQGKFQSPDVTNEEVVNNEMGI